MNEKGETSFNQNELIFLERRDEFGQFDLPMTNTLEGRDAPALPVAKYQHLGGRPEQTDGHISYFISRKIRHFVNHVDQLSP